MSQSSIDRTLKKIQDLRTIEMFGDQEKMIKDHIEVLERAIKQVSEEIVLFINGELPGYKRLIRSLPPEGRPIGRGGWSDQRLLNLVDQIDLMTKEIQKITGKSIDTASTEMIKDVYRTYPDIFSFDDSIPSVSFTKMTVEQLEAAAYKTKLGGQIAVADAIERTFIRTMKIDMRNDLLVASMKGESIPKITKRIKKNYPWISQKQINQIYRQIDLRGLTGNAYLNEVSRRFEKTINNNAITTARSHMQQVASDAMEEVFDQNDDIITGYEWNATLEPGYQHSGRGTCIRCMALDGTVYKKDEDRPPIPLHPNCRCIYTPILIPWKELDIDAEEVIRENRPYAIRESDVQIASGEGKAIGKGGRKIMGPVGDEPTARQYPGWYGRQNPNFQVNALGPNRAAHILNKYKKTGKWNFSSLVDKATGDLKTLDEIHGAVPTSMTRDKYLKLYDKTM